MNPQESPLALPLRHPAAALFARPAAGRPAGVCQPRDCTMAVAAAARAGRADDRGAARYRGSAICCRRRCLRRSIPDRIFAPAPAASRRDAVRVPDFVPADRRCRLARGGAGCGDAGGDFHFLVAGRHPRAGARAAHRDPGRRRQFDLRRGRDHGHAAGGARQAGRSGGCGRHRSAVRHAGDAVLSVAVPVEPDGPGAAGVGGSVRPVYRARPCMRSRR